MLAGGTALPVYMQTFQAMRAFKDERQAVQHYSVKTVTVAVTVQTKTSHRLYSTVPTVRSLDICRTVSEW